jgi:hypothetical protein
VHGVFADAEELGQVQTPEAFPAHLAQAHDLGRLEFAGGHFFKDSLRKGFTLFKGGRILEA